MKILEAVIQQTQIRGTGQLDEFVDTRRESLKEYFNKSYLNPKCLYSQRDFYSLPNCPYHSIHNLPSEAMIYWGGEGTSTLAILSRGEVGRISIGGRILAWSGLGLIIWATIYFFTATEPLVHSGDPFVDSAATMGVLIRLWISGSIALISGSKLIEKAQVESSYQLNCQDCRFADHEAKRRKDPWCTKPTPPERGKDGRCYSREARSVA